jgi:hypothetical protein
MATNKTLNKASCDFLNRFLDTNRSTPQAQSKTLAPRALIKMGIRAMLFISIQLCCVIQGEDNASYLRYHLKPENDSKVSPYSIALSISIQRR